MKIAESVALFVGGALLLLSLLTDFVWKPNFNVNINLNFLNVLVQRNSPLATGFVAGYLIGFAII